MQELRSRRSQSRADFEDIAEKLGISVRDAQKAFASGMRKLESPKNRAKWEEIINTKRMLANLERTYV